MGEGIPSQPHAATSAAQKPEKSLGQEELSLPSCCLYRALREGL